MTAMPTGYTAGVADGTVTTLRGYALTCARAMGALVSLRDAPFDAPIPERLEPDIAYHVEALADAQERFTVLQASGLDARKVGTADWNSANREHRQQAVDHNDELRRRYTQMRVKVVAWANGPKGLKDFMLEQLDTGMNADWAEDPLRYLPAERTVDQWFESEIIAAARDVTYHAKAIAEETVRTAERNAWLDQLRISLPPAEGDQP